MFLGLSFYPAPGLIREEVFEDLQIGFFVFVELAVVVDLLQAFVAVVPIVVGVVEILRVHADPHRWITVGVW